MPKLAARLSRREFSLSLCAVAVALVVWSQFNLTASQPAPALCDLTIDANQLRASLKLKIDQFKAGDCAIVEGCVTGGGKRSLLKFDVAIPNVGSADLVLGNPADNLDLFYYSPCHGHYHLLGFASYELLDSTGATVVTGRKQAFCLEDFTQLDPNAGPAKYTCSNQGISVGWSDVYGSYLDCQWLDVTNVPAGTYMLKVVVNSDSVTHARDGNANLINPALVESNYQNNVAMVPVTLKK